MSIEQVGNVAQPVVSPVDVQVARQQSSAAQMDSTSGAGQVQATPQPNSVDAQKASNGSVHDLNNAVNTTNKFMLALSQNLQFSIDKDTSKVVVKLTDVATKEVIRQIPSEEMLSIAKALDKLQGLLIREKA